MRSNFGQIGQLAIELAALERVKNRCLHCFAVAVEPILFKLTSYKDMHKILDEFELLRAKKNFPHFIGYQNFINDLTKLVSSQTLAHVQLRVCLKY